MIIDAGNSNFHDSQRRAAQLAEKGIEWLDFGVSAAASGACSVGFCAMIGGKREVFDRFEPTLKTTGTRGRLPLLRAGRRGPLREDGAQRHRVRRDAGLRRGLRHPARLGATSSTSPRSRGCGNNGSVIRSWLLELAGDAFTRRATTWTRSSGWVADSGEGRWTVVDAIDHDVPGADHHAAPDPALPQPPRARTRFTDRVLAALRNEFGGHAVEVVEARAPEPMTDDPIGASRTAPSSTRRCRSDELSGDRGERARTRCARACALERMPEPCTMVICGATGDLTERKLGAGALQPDARRLPAARVHASSASRAAT